jgi:pimeloyl-ACP methyl ester carboxylesterase
MKQEYIQVDDIKTFFVSVGTGHPLLWLHGASPVASSLVNWKLNLEPLAAAGFTVYAYDQSGFGHTENAIGSFDRVPSYPMQRHSLTPKVG